MSERTEWLVAVLTEKMGELYAECDGHAEKMAVGLARFLDSPDIKDRAHRAIAEWIVRDVMEGLDPKMLPALKGLGHTLRRVRELRQS